MALWERPWEVSFLVTSVISGFSWPRAACSTSCCWAWLCWDSALYIWHSFEWRTGPKLRRHQTQSPRTLSPSRARSTFGALYGWCGVPGLLALIAFSCFNNFLAGAFMALMDAYGLYLMSVQAWGLLWGALSTCFILGGLAVAKTGLSKNPVRLLLLVNIGFWSVTCLFPLQASVILLAAGMAVYMLLGPYAEAAEQTILQKVVPYERPAGVRPSVELAASPLTAFLIGPITQLIFIPFMTTGAGADMIGGWFGTGPDRGIALVFILTGLLGLAVTILALFSRPYRQLSTRYAGEPEPALTASMISWRAYARI